MNKIRDGKIEFLRFIAALIIMCGHMGYFESNIPRPFAGGWVYVEFFLILSGFFTVQHFDRVQGENKVKLGLEYTWNKFKRFLPFTIPAVLCAWSHRDVSFVPVLCQRDTPLWLEIYQ